MKLIPFVAFPSAEQDALIAVLRRAGVGRRGLCASRMVWDDGAAADVAGYVTVSGPDLCRTYAAGAELAWLGALERDLAAAGRPAPL